MQFPMAIARRWASGSVGYSSVIAPAREHVGRGEQEPNDWLHRRHWSAVGRGNPLLISRHGQAGQNRLAVTQDPPDALLGRIAVLDASLPVGYAAVSESR